MSSRCAQPTPQNLLLSFSFRPPSSSSISAFKLYHAKPHPTPAQSKSSPQSHLQFSSSRATIFPTSPHNKPSATAAICASTTDLPVPAAASPPPPTFSAFFFPPAPRRNQSPTPAPDQAYLSLATSSSPFFSFLFNPSEFRHIGLVSKTCLLLFSPFIKRIIPLVRHLHGLLMADMSGTRQHLIKV